MMGDDEKYNDMSADELMRICSDRDDEIEELNDTIKALQTAMNSLNNSIKDWMEEIIELKKTGKGYEKIMEKTIDMFMKMGLK